jgi:tripartite-type tricarboxylate transporter receptor subunit TctC
MRVFWLFARPLLSGLLAITVASQVHAQGEVYPTKPVNIIADSAAGSTPDVVFRVIADSLSRVWGQQVVSVNHPGAGGSIAARLAADAVPDGYTLYGPVLSTFVSLPGTAANLPLQVPRDFTVIGFTAENPMFIAVTPSLPVSSLPELIAQAKARPGELSYAVTGVGRLTNLAGELLQTRADIKLLSVPYTGGPAHAMGDVMSGRVSLVIEGFSGIAGAVQSGKLKAIAVASPKRLPEFPDLPAVSETLPDFSATGWQVLVAPLGTPERIIAKASEDLRKVLSDPELQKKISARGSYARPMTPAEATAFVHAEQQKWKPVVEHIAAKTQ